MIKVKFVYLMLAIIILSGNTLCGQGCSDAGFCTISSFKPNSQDSLKSLINQFKIGAFYGKADNSIVVFGNYLEYNRQFNSKFGLDAKLTTLSQSGNSVSTFGISDLFLTANYNASEKFKVTLSAKIPLSNANKIKEDLPLPMDYQPSLGTLDLILGLGYEVKKIQLVAAIQQPLTQNDNQFLSEIYPVIRDCAVSNQPKNTKGAETCSCECRTRLNLLPSLK